MNAGLVRMNDALVSTSASFVLARRASRAARIVMSMGVGGSSL